MAHAAKLKNLYQINPIITPKYISNHTRMDREKEKPKLEVHNAKLHTFPRHHRLLNLEHQTVKNQ